jgi:hypothetical protein
MLFSSQESEIETLGCIRLSIWAGRDKRKEQKATKSPMKHSGHTQAGMIALPAWRRYLQLR